MSVESAFVTFGASFLESPRMTAAKAHGGVVVVTALWVEMASYCARTASDGVVPDHALRTLDVPTRVRSKALAAMAEHGVLERTEGGYLLVDFLKWNAPRKVRVEASQRRSNVAPRSSQRRRSVEEATEERRSNVEEATEERRPVPNDSETLDASLSAKQSIAKQSEERESVKEKPTPTRPSLELRPAPDGGSPVPPWVSLPTEATFRPMVQRVFPEDFVPDAQDAKVALRYGLDREEVARVVRDLRGSVIGGNGFRPGYEHHYFRRALGWAKDRKESQGKRTG